MAYFCIDITFIKRPRNYYMPWISIRSCCKWFGYTGQFWKSDARSFKLKVRLTKSQHHYLSNAILKSELYIERINIWPKVLLHIRKMMSDIIVFPCLGLDTITAMYSQYILQYIFKISIGMSVWHCHQIAVKRPTD